MITKQEVMEFSRKFGLPANVIEKDYILGWLLAGIYVNKNLSSKWVFKGGTCLKKCYFETYRFSEDLDFTLTDTTHLENDFLLQNFISIVKWVNNYSGIEIPAELVKFDIYQNSRGGFSAVGKIGYRGPLQRKSDLARIKIDLTGDEVLVGKSLQRSAHHPYSDAPSEGFKVMCYSYEEIFAEKIRALIERARPRDLYDVIHLYRHRLDSQLKLNHHVVVKILQEKCSHRKIKLSNFSDIQNALGRDKLEAEWKDMLAHQLPVLPPFEQFWDELPILFAWIFDAIEKAPLPTIVTRSLFGAPIQSTTFKESIFPLEGIEFAATSHLCIEIDYIKENGAQKKYLVEPYSLRSSKENNAILYAVKHDTGETRAFRLDRIQEIKNSTVSFTPKYSIEITTSSNF